MLNDAGADGADDGWWVVVTRDGRLSHKPHRLLMFNVNVNVDVDVDVDGDVDVDVVVDVDVDDVVDVDVVDVDGV